MELRHLRYFVAAAEAENVSRAAARLHLSQPALSRQLRDLEEELGFALFERSPKAVRLTEAGKVFLKESRAVLARAEEAVNTARAAARGSTELQVGYAPTPMARLMPATLRLFQGQVPGARVRLHDLSTLEMLAGVREGKLQVSFLVRPNRALLRGLQFQELARDTVCVAVPPAHTLARLRSATLAQAAAEPLIAFSREEYPEYHEHLAAWFAPIKTKPRIAEEHDSASSLIAAVESGAGVALVPASFSCSAGPRLKLVALEPPPAPLVLGAVWPKRGATAAAEGFVQAAKQAAAALASG
jgi:DNA-binding transcriptional LysR family regulator